MFHDDWRAPFLPHDGQKLLGYAEWCVSGDPWLITIYHHINGEISYNWDLNLVTEIFTNVFYPKRVFKMGAYPF